MKKPNPVAAAAVACLAAAMVSTDVWAGSSTYDVSVLLARPHPFAAATAALPEAGRPLHEAEVTREAAAPGAIARRGLAQTPAAETERTDDPGFLIFGAGWYDFNDSEDAAEFRLEWRGRQWFWGIKPLVGVMATGDAAVYGYGGLALDIYFGRRIVVTPSFAAGLHHEGDGKDLGSAIEFRSALEIGWRFDDRSRLSAMVYHLSNADIDDANPGTEVFSIGYSLPF